MGKRDQFKTSIRTLFASTGTSPTSSRLVLPPPAQRPPTPSSQPTSPLTVTNGLTLAPTTSHNPVLEKALAIHLQKIPEAEKAAFQWASKSLDEQTLLSNVRVYDEAHKDKSSFRPHAERLSKFLDLLNRFMGGVAISIQANPEISAVVVGALRIVIDLALKFTTFFSRLTDMICTFEDFLRPLAEYARAADIELVEKAVVNVYVNVLDFGWKAHRVFINANGDKRRWTSLRKFMRQHWETFESEFVAIKEDMQHHFDVLQHSVLALHFDASRRAEQMRRREEEKKERSAFLSWVSSVDFEEVHQGIYAKKHEKTGNWLIHEPKYQQWLQSPDSSLLWCHGKPGIGKSVLASNVIEHITAEAGLREDTAICFAYYNYRDTQLANISRIITALVKQLCRRRDSIPPSLLQIKHDALSPSLVGTQEWFISLIEDLSQVYVILDALDECPEQNREDILSFITSVVTVPVPCRVKVFVTSRREMDIAKAFEDKHIPTVQIQAENVAADIETFVRSQVEKLRAGEHGKTLYVTSDDVKERIVLTLARKADGMFLWVNLQLDNLCQVSKARKDQLVEDALETLPQGLRDTYFRILERIEGQSPYMRELALGCLAWMIYAQRPLTTGELQVALATKSECESCQDLQYDPPEVILEACGNLLEGADGAIRPIHYTVQEFLATIVQGVPPGTIKALLQDSSSMHIRLSLACLSYIRMVSFNRPAQCSSELYYRLGENKFSGYACQNFDYHILTCGEVSPEVMEQLVKFFHQGCRSLGAVLQIKVLRDGFTFLSVMRHFDSMQFSVSASTIVYSTGLYFIPAVRQRWLDRTPPTYALHLASSAGLTSAVVRLIDAGCDVNEANSNGATPLYHACFEGHLNIIRKLLERGANVNAQGGPCDNALQAASTRGHVQVVMLLLDNIDAQGSHYGKVLQVASAEGHKEIVMLLLDKGANVNAQGGTEGNALQAASAEGHLETVILLLNKGADVNAQGGAYGNALQVALLKGHKEIVILLLNKGAL